MTISIPAKTFLIGEYAVLQGAPGLLLTTKPCFELRVGHGVNSQTQGIHPQSPAGLWLSQQAPLNACFEFFDPYQGLGGLGASSAQFIALFKAYHHLTQQAYTTQSLLNSYQDVAYNGHGRPPSGYDVIAQCHQGVVAYDASSTSVYDWPFEALDFVLIRTQQKLATHTHLQNLPAMLTFEHLSHISSQALQCFETNNADLLCQTINAYARELKRLNLVSPHTETLINTLTPHPGVKAIKGCGAMGADIVLILIDQSHTQALRDTLSTKSLPIVGSSKDLYQQQ